MMPFVAEDHTLGVFILGDARSFFAVASKIPPLGPMLNFDADVIETTSRHQRKNRLRSSATHVEDERGDDAERLEAGAHVER